MNYLLQAGLEAGLILVLNVANVCPAELCSGCEGAVADNGIRWVCVCVYEGVWGAVYTCSISSVPTGAGFPECLSGSC